MKQLQQDKYSVAWFKLAEFVSRGEKERALGLYRLLFHSFDDKALGLQLEGDILSAFNDPQAYVKYADAAKLYFEHKRFNEATAMYEVVFSKEPTLDIMHMLCQLYTILQMPDRLYKKLVCFLSDIDEKKDSIILSSLLQRLKIDLTQDIYRKTLQHIIMFFTEKKSRREEMQSYLRELVDEMADEENSKKLQAFLAKLEAIDHDMYQHAIDYITSNTNS